MQLVKQQAGTKHTEIGVIPADWEIVRADDACVKIQDGTHFSPTIQGNDFYYLTSKNIRPGFLNLSDALRIDEAQHRAIYKRCDVKKGDLLLTKDGANTGNAALNPLSVEFSLLSSVAFLRFHPKRYSAGYFLQQILTSSGQRQIQEAMAGNAITRLTLAKIKRLQFPTPPTLAEQEAIAGALSDADGLIESLETLIAKKRQIKHGAMQELLTGKRRLPGFSGKWETKRLGECGEVIMGQSPPGSSYNQQGIGSPLINGPTEFTDRFPVKMQWTTEPARFCRAGDLLICVRGSSTGRTNFADDTYAIGRGVAAIRANGINNTEFISLQVVAGVASILAAATGSTFPSVDGASFRKIMIALPAPAEQSAIAAILSDMETEIEALGAKQAKARQVKQGMMQELLTGRTRLI